MPWRTGPEWSVERLRGWLTEHYKGESIVVLANREPFRHDRSENGAVLVRRTAGGLVTALEPLMQACSGVWVAHGAGTADRVMVDGRDGVSVPSGRSRYRLRRVWLDRDEERGYYYGFSNEGLWPLCHRTPVSPVFRAGDFEKYRTVNARFADAVCQEAASPRPLVLVQDYHFACAPQFIRDRLPLSTIIAFWHIPWPRPSDYAQCPWGDRLLEGLLSSTVVGLQTADDCRNFLDTVEAVLDAEVDRRQHVIWYRGRQTAVRDYAVSIEWPNRWATQTPSAEICRAAVCRELGLATSIRLGVGVDRLDYTKGIEEKFLAVERLLEREPDFRERFTFVQIAEPSRESLPAYQRVRARIARTAERINVRFGTHRYRPIVVREAHHEPAEVYRFLRAADLCYVNSLHDGMNLVAKEFVCARDDRRGVLILSQFAGASRELRMALIVNPYDTDVSARALAHALRMPMEEQANRLCAMRSIVGQHNTYRWAGEILMDATRMRAAEHDLDRYPRRVAERSA